MNNEWFVIQLSFVCPFTPETSDACWKWTNKDKSCSKKMEINKIYCTLVGIFYNLRVYSPHNFAKGHKQSEEA